MQWHMVYVSFKQSASIPYSVYSSHFCVISVDALLTILYERMWCFKPFWSHMVEVVWYLWGNNPLWIFVFTYVFLPFNSYVELSALRAKAPGNYENSVRVSINICQERNYFKIKSREGLKRIIVCKQDRTVHSMQNNAQMMGRIILGEQQTVVLHTKNCEKCEGSYPYHCLISAEMCELNTCS